MAKQISKTSFVQDVEAGLSKSELVEKYGVPAAWVAEQVKGLGLKLKRKMKPKFVLVDEEAATAETSTTSDETATNEEA